MSASALCLRRRLRTGLDSPGVGFDIAYLSDLSSKLDLLRSIVNILLDREGPVGSATTPSRPASRPTVAGHHHECYMRFMASDVSDITVHVLREIRDEVRKTNGRLDQTNERLDQTNERLARLEQRQTKTEVRLASELVAVATAVQELTSLIREDRDLRRTVQTLDHRVTTLEEKVG